MITVERYNSSKSKEWDNLIHKSKNGTFLLDRNFMDYHSDRFEDCSLMIYRNNKLEAVFPANIVDTTIYSHQGLTYGGVIYSTKISTTDMLGIFNEIVDFYKKLNVKRILYKAIPYIYHSVPAQEDLYALFKIQAKIIGCNISSTIDVKLPLGFNDLRKRAYKKAIKNNVSISLDSDFESFWKILEDNLISKYGVKPVHSLDEILLLKSRFPSNIFVHTVEKEAQVLAGVVMFVDRKVAHVQYISANDEGKNNGALDLLFYELINNIYKNFDYFDFGQSTEQNGKYLNESLIFQKEGFGGRGVVYNVYEIPII